MMSLSEFLAKFIQGMNKASIEHCVLRNYDGLPENNSGNDIDFLIRKEQAKQVIGILSNIEQVSITALTERDYVVSLFIHGVSWGEGRTAIQIDLVTSLCWKGLPYLDSSIVYNCMSAVPSTNGLINKPAIYHEAIISFFSSYLLGGWIKDRYQKSVQAVFVSNKNEVLNVLQGFLSLRLASSLIGAVRSDDRTLMLALLPKVKRQLFFSQLGSKPVKTLINIKKYYLRELKIRFTAYPITSICFLGPDGAGKSSVISALTANLSGAVKGISYVHLKPTLKESRITKNHVTEDPYSMPPRSAFISIAKLIWWLVLYWQDHFFHKKRCATLRIWDRYYYDVYIDPKRYRYGGPIWFAKLIGKLVPKPELIIILDAPAEIIHARKQEVTLEETTRQRAAYLQFAKESSNVMLLNTNQSFEKTEASGLQTVLAYMEKKEKLRIKLHDAN